MNDSSSGSISDAIDTLWPLENDLESTQISVAEVAVDVDAPDLKPTYTYRIPAQLQGAVVPGSCVFISFNRREVLGWVVSTRSISAADPLVRKLVNISELLDESASITLEQLELAQYMSVTCVCDLIAAVRCMAPSLLASRIETRVAVTDVEARGFQITRSASQAHLYETLRTLGGEAEVGRLKQETGIPDFQAALSALIARKAVAQTRGLIKPKVVAKTTRVYSLSQHADRELTTFRAGAMQAKILNLLSEQARMGGAALTSAEIASATGAGPASVKALVSRGVVTMAERLEHRSPTAGLPTGVQAPALSQQQSHAAASIRQAIEGGDESTILLFGVTASGKTEVYLNAITHTLSIGKTAILLVPEIALTAQVVEVFVGRFGEQVAVLHSRLSDGERHDEWRRIQHGHARIVVGARSAVFAPVSNIGLIILDEEHEASYKQDKSPRYSARELAAHRAQQSSATLVLGSATPSIETYWATTDEGQQLLASAGESGIKRVTMSQRIDSRPLPHVEVVDLREEFKTNKSLFSERLTTAIGHRLREGQQTILFLNRRGYSQFILCRDCGWTARCPNCAVSLAYHSYDQSLKCHHCNYSGRTPTVCPDCRGAKVKAFGVGTEKVEEEVLKIYPSARVSRMDRDTTSTKGAHARIMRQFRDRDTDILIGTQMVAKGLDFPGVTLVGVITADTAINMPDFRAAERTFQLLTQVAGRSGRGKQPGEVIIQTFSPEHYSVQAAVFHDYQRFYEQEIQYRSELKYPPYSRLANIIISNESEVAARQQATIVAGAILAVKHPNAEMIGPSPAPIERVKNLYRYHVALRAPLTVPLEVTVSKALQRLDPAHRRGVSIDMDPLSMA